VGLTNSHVVHGRSRVLVETVEGDALDAEVTGDDPATDLAVLRVAASDLPHAALGESASLRVGQLVIAMGSPLGLEATVSTGIVSAVNRTMRGESGRLIEDVIQHTAPINPGNSGGPLLDSRSRVAGVNTATVVAAQGLGFAVPIDTARRVLDELAAHGRVRRRHLGVTARTASIARSLVRELDLLSPHAVEVIEIEASGPGARAGVRPGDLIVAINDRIVASVDDVHRLLALAPPSVDVHLTVVRGRHRLELPCRWSA
jgi:S1-C subfamily serine protease